MTRQAFISTKTTLFLSLLGEARGVKHYRPLLLQELAVRLPGLRIRRLRLNRHLPEVELVGEHSHAYSQILFYLGGRGQLITGGGSSEIATRSLAFLPPRCRHSFRETTGRRPLCLVIDLDWRGAIKHGVSVGRLSTSDAGVVRRELSGLTRLPDPDDAGCRLVVAAGVLGIVDTLFRGLRILPERNRETPSFVRRVDRIFRRGAMPLPGVREAAAQLGYQPDYLNRIFKQATGQTLKEYRDVVLAEKARRLLGERRRVRDVCDALGFADQNYFSRWFKKTTGLQPREVLGTRPDISRGV